MHNTQSLRHLIILLLIIGNTSVMQSQSKFVNNGSQLIVESGSMLVIQGEIINTTSGNYAIKLSGEMSVSGDFTNKYEFTLMRLIHR